MGVSAIRLGGGAALSAARDAGDRPGPAAEAPTGLARRWAYGLVKAFDGLLVGGRWPRLDAWLTAQEGRGSDFIFLQIGANDGVVHDPIHAHVRRAGWRGVLVEPSARYFARLQENYRGVPGLTFVHAAIGARAESRTLYRIADGCDFLPAWTQGIASFDREVLLSHRRVVPGIEAYIVTEEVRAMTLASLLAAPGDPAAGQGAGIECIKRLDLLLVDTEGHDYEVIRQIPFAHLAPSVIVYEHKHLDRASRRACRALLAGHGYRLARHWSNTLAWLPERAGPL